MAFLRRRKKLRLFLIFVLVLGLLFGVYRIQLERLVKKSEEAYLALGYPLDLAELNDLYPAVPDEENAALLYVAASELVRLEDDDIERLPYFGIPDERELGPPMSMEMRARIASFLDRNAEAYKLLHEAASYPRSRYPVELRDGHYADMPYLARARNNARLLGIESLYRSDLGDVEGTVKALIASFGIGRSLADEPVYISSLVRSGIDGISVAALNDAVEHLSMEDSHLIRLSEAIETSRRTPALADIFAVELCMHYAEVKKWGSTDIDNWKDEEDPIAVFLYSELPWLGKTWLVAKNLTGAHLYSRKRFLNVSADIMSHSTLSHLDAYEYYSTSTYDSWLESDIEFLFGMVSGVWPLIIQSIQSSEARLSVAQTALAVERFRLSEGRLPYELLELVPAFLDGIPPDPFTGTPLIYMQTDDGYRVYSVGRNFVDEDGNGYGSGERHLGDDIGCER